MSEKSLFGVVAILHGQSRPKDLQIMTAHCFAESEAEALGLLTRSMMPGGTSEHILVGRSILNTIAFPIPTDEIEQLINDLRPDTEATVARVCEWQPIDENTPRNIPILAWCNHEVDPYILEQTPDGRTELTLYAAHAEGMCHAPTGMHIIEWGGSFDDSTWEEPGSSLPDWWFVAGSEFEVAANPTHWMPLPAPPLSAVVRDALDGKGTDS